MKMCFVTFRSVTPAQKAERLLKATGVSCTIVRTPKWMEEQGCGYSLRIPQRQLHQSIDILRDSRVDFRKIYLRLDNGTMEAIEV